MDHPRRGKMRFPFEPFALPSPVSIPGDAPCSGGSQSPFCFLFHDRWARQRHYFSGSNRLEASGQGPWNA
jgi:hypothetical protein